MTKAEAVMRVHPVALALLTAAWSMTAVPAARADEVSDQIDKARTAWSAHDSQAAIVALEAAANLLRQARADALELLLPLPLLGWVAEAPETSSVSAAMLGGGTSASRTYHNDTQEVHVQITTDSPMLQGMAALLNSPLAVAAGVRSVTIRDRVVSYTESDNGYMTLVADKIIVKVDGSKTTPEASLRSFVAAIDFDAIEKLARQ
jgi:hypothetical protein